MFINLLFYSLTERPLSAGSLSWAPHGRVKTEKTPTLAGLLVQLGENRNTRRYFIMSSQEGPYVVGVVLELGWGVDSRQGIREVAFKLRSLGEEQSARQRAGCSERTASAKALRRKSSQPAGRSSQTAKTGLG